jgi:hypothetical protein
VQRYSLCQTSCRCTSYRRRRVGTVRAAWDRQGCMGSRVGRKPLPESRPSILRRARIVHRSAPSRRRTSGTIGAGSESRLGAVSLARPILEGVTAARKPWLRLGGSLPAAVRSQLLHIVDSIRRTLIDA